MFPLHRIHDTSPGCDIQQFSSTPETPRIWTRIEPFIRQQRCQIDGAPTRELHVHITHIRKRFHVVRFGAGHDVVENRGGLADVAACRQNRSLSESRRVRRFAMPMLLEIEKTNPRKSSQALLDLVRGTPTNCCPAKPECINDAGRGSNLPKADRTYEFHRQIGSPRRWHSRTHETAIVTSDNSRENT